MRSNVTYLLKLTGLKTQKPGLWSKMKSSIRDLASFQMHR
jgi:hypothetical protein